MIHFSDTRLSLCTIQDCCQLLSLLQSQSLNPESREWRQLEIRLLYLLRVYHPEEYLLQHHDRVRVLQRSLAPHLFRDHSQ